MIGAMLFVILRMCLNTYVQSLKEDVLTKKTRVTCSNLANNFGICHHNEAQKVQYEKPIWYSWLFHDLSRNHSRSRTPNSQGQKPDNDWAVGLNTALRRTPAEALRD